MDNQRNLLIAVALSAVLLLGWDAMMSALYPQPASVAQAERVDAPSERAEITTAGGTIDQDLEAPADLDTTLASAGRVPIRAPSIAGSINPVGARVDDVLLLPHRQSIEEDSGPIRLFAPAGTPAQHFAQFGWVGTGVETPDRDTVWQASGGPLAPGSPVMLRWDNGAGQRFGITLAVDEHYMLTARQTVANAAGGPIVLQPFAVINRDRASAAPDQWLVQSGPIGAFGDSIEFGIDYDDLREDGEVIPEGRASWLGFTDIYWMSALVSEPGVDTDSAFRPLDDGLFRADLVYDPVTVPAGEAASRTTRLFVGAKETELLDAYEAAGVDRFGLAIDWGWFRWFEKPIFWVLRQLEDFAGNFGVAIILLTVLIRLLLFPIAQKQFASMAGMRAIAPKMKALQERFKDDKQKQQQEIMALYKKEGVNPLAGCLPMLVQIPIFFALYKVLILAIEMRHKPFALWIDDLSAPDPATILNLFGLLDFTPPSFLAIGVLAVLLGVTMWLTFRLNPTAMDPMQQQIFNIMPWLLMFVMAPFAAGLLIYWITNNLLTLAQQTYLYSRHPQLKAQAEKDRAEKAAKAEEAKTGNGRSKA